MPQRTGGFHARNAGNTRWWRRDVAAHARLAAGVSRTPRHHGSPGDARAIPAAPRPPVRAPGDVLDAFTIGARGVTDAPPATPTGLALNDVHPDPAGATFTPGYSLADGGEVRLELLDVAGRSVRRIALGPAGPGRDEAEVSTPPGTPPGIYWLRLSQSGHDTRRSVVLLP